MSFLIFSFRDSTLAFSTHYSLYFLHPFPHINFHLWIPFHFPIWFFGLRPSNASTSILIINLFRSLRAFFLSLRSVHFTSVVNVSLTVGWASFRCGSTATVNKIFKVRGTHARNWGLGKSSMSLGGDIPSAKSDTMCCGSERDTSAITDLLPHYEKLNCI